MMDILKVCIPLVLLLIQHVFANVPPVEDVILHCRNRHNVLHWTYSRTSGQPVRFRVDLTSSYSPPRELWVEPPDHHCDISPFTENLNDDYAATVTAAIGGNQSEAAPPSPLTFSYNRVALATQDCLLDMPTVNLSVLSEHSVGLHFLHPFLLYGDGDEADSSDVNYDYETEETQTDELLTEFAFDVSTGEQQGETSGHSCVTRVCHTVVPLGQEEKKNHCVTVRGWMKDHLIGPNEYCTVVKERNDHRGLVALSLGIVAVLLVLGCVSVMVYHKNTKGSYPSLPAFMTPKLKSMIPPPLCPEHTGVSLVQAAGHTPLLDPQEEAAGFSVPPSTHPELRLSCGVQSEAVSPGDVLPSRDPSGSPCVEETGQDDGYRQGAEMDEEEEEESISDRGYDRTHALFSLEMAPEDMVDAYRESH